MQQRVVTAAVPATCGELFQGTLDGVPCLVSCPIDTFSYATVNITDKGGWQVEPAGGHTKSRAALRRFASDFDGCVRLQSQLPRGRGYGTSTADIGATLYGASAAAGDPLTPEAAAAIALHVEPTDGTLFPGLVCFDHRYGSFCLPLGSVPSLVVIVLDPGGTIDTVQFNRFERQTALAGLADRHREAFALLRTGLVEGDLEQIGAATTLSVEAHQRILESSLLGPARRLATEIGALGICRAHSGTILGLLVDPTAIDVSTAAEYVHDRLSDVHVATYSLVGGGPRYVQDTPTERRTALIRSNTFVERI